MNDPILLRTAIRERIEQLNDTIKCRMFFTKADGKRLVLWKEQDGKKAPICKVRYTSWGLRSMLNRLNEIQIIFI